MSREFAIQLLFYPTAHAESLNLQTFFCAIRPSSENESKIGRRTISNIEQRTAFCDGFRVEDVSAKFNEKSNFFHRKLSWFTEKYEIWSVEFDFYRAVDVSLEITAAVFWSSRILMEMLKSRSFQTENCWFFVAFLTVCHANRMSTHHGFCVPTG